MTKAKLFVLLQFLLLILLFYRCGVFASWPWLVIQLLGSLLGVWAILQFEFKDLAVSPVPKSQAKLIRSGPYQWIRNPMYLSVLLWCLPLALEARSLVSGLLFLCLVVLMVMKLNYEESLLKAHYAGFDAYRKGSKKLIPFIY